MKTIVVERRASALAIAFSLALAASPAIAQDATAESGDADQPVAVETAGADIYMPEDFARFAPKNALDMLNQVPGFQLQNQNQERGLGQASENVLINGERLASKSDGVFDQLSRITAGRVVRIEIVDGARFGIPGLSGQVANVVIKDGAISGRYEYRASFRPKYAKPSFWGGEASISGQSGNFDWSAAYSHGTGRGGAGGGDGIQLYDRFGQLIEDRTSLTWFKGDFPSLTGRVKWDAPNSDTVANFSAQFGLQDTKFNNDEWRRPVGGVSYFRDFLNKDSGYSYDLSGDIEFGLGPGRLKLIAIERFQQSDGPATSYNIYDDGRPTTGSRFYTDQDSGERIGRAEYGWEMLGGSWQLDAEAAFNRLDRIATFGLLKPDGEFDIQPLPSGTGGVTEDRYESILTHNRRLTDNLTLQLGVGGEYSKLSQTGAQGLTREFWRPKGSLNVAWVPEKGTDVSLKISRTVGQLSFGTFLATVDLQQNNNNAGNVRLVPQQAWEAELELKRNLGVWGSIRLRGYAQLIEDYIDIVPVPGGESLGNIDGTAKVIGVAGNATLNFDPIGWKGAKWTSSFHMDQATLPDPLTGETRPWSNNQDFRTDHTLRWDIPDTDWAIAGGFQLTHNDPYFRLGEFGVNGEGPAYTFAFVENKDVFGLTVRLQAFNLTSGAAYGRRYVYTGLRDRTPLLFFEDGRTDVSTIFNLSVKGSF